MLKIAITQWASGACTVKLSENGKLVVEVDAKNRVNAIIVARNLRRLINDGGSHHVAAHAATLASALEG